MRRALCLAALITLSTAAAAHAEHWTKYIDEANGTAWSYDADYSYKDRSTNRLVVMQAISKPAANLGPSAPGKADGVGSIVALDCGQKNLISLGAFSPSKPLSTDEGWRSATPKKADGPDNDALMAAVCPTADHLPVK